MRWLILVPCLTLAGCCSLCPPKIIEVPVAEPVPTIAMPVEPQCPTLDKASTPKQIMQYCAERIFAQEGYIKQLQEILRGITKE